MSADAPSATLLPSMRFCRLTSELKASLVPFFSTRRAARSALTAALRAFLSSVASARGRLMTSRGTASEARCERQYVLGRECKG